MRSSSTCTSSILTLFLALYFLRLSGFHRCLKLYCQCFASSTTCGPTCKCQVCHNTTLHGEDIDAARRTILDRNPTAFDDKFRTPPSVVLPAMPHSATRAWPPHPQQLQPSPPPPPHHYHPQQQHTYPMAPSPHRHPAMPMGFPQKQQQQQQNNHSSPGGHPTPAAASAAASAAMMSPPLDSPNTTTAWGASSYAAGPSSNPPRVSPHQMMMQPPSQYYHVNPKLQQQQQPPPRMNKYGCKCRRSFCLKKVCSRKTIVIRGVL